MQTIVKYNQRQTAKSERMYVSWMNKRMNKQMNRMNETLALFCYNMAVLLDQINVFACPFEATQKN